MFLLVLLACSREPAAPVPPTTTAPAPATAPATPDPRPAPHGGEVKRVGSVWLEAKFMPDGLLVWVTGEDGKAIDAAGFPGAIAVIESGGTKREAPLHPMGEHLHASATLQQGAPANAVVTIPVDGASTSTTFATSSVGMAEHEHTAIHGGAVAMWGPYHVEYAPAEGEYRFFVSDAKRQTIDKAVSGTVKDGDDTHPLTFDPARGLLHARGDGAGTRPVTLDVTVGELTFSVGFEASARAKSEGTGHHEAGHHAGSHGEGHEDGTEH